MGNHEKVFAFCDSGCRVETLPKDYIERMFRAKQLLINKDFQINQRGQSEYSNNSENNAQYTLDMWQLNGSTANLTKLDNGVKFSTGSSTESSSLMQKINDSSIARKTLTVSCKVDGEIYNATGIPFDESIKIETSKFKLYVSWNLAKSLTQVSFVISGGNSIDIEYVDLFEGDIAYSHVKKDHYDDLLECQRYLKLGKYAGTIIYQYYISSDIYSYKVWLNFENMASTPAFNLIDAYYYDHSGNIENVTVKEMHDINKRYVEFVTSEGTKKDVENNAVLCDVELSCEIL